MAALEETLVSNSTEHSSCNGEFVRPVAVAKGKRTRRRRSQQLPVPSAIVSDSSSASSAELSGSITEEDEHMANCLILLAQGRPTSVDAGPKPEPMAEEDSSARLADQAAAAATTGAKVGFYVYECKTCSKCFPSFQALGGHRASHKKPKLAAVLATAAEEKKAIVHDETLQTSVNSFLMPVHGIDHQSGSKAKIHECSICGSEFSSGQALGGHMRRHRPAAVVVPEIQEGKKERNLLPLDLNLPAPADDERAPSPAFAFTGERPLVFPASASALVGCHY